MSLLTQSVPHHFTIEAIVCLAGLGVAGQGGGKHWYFVSFLSGSLVLDMVGGFAFPVVGREGGRGVIGVGARILD